MSGRDKALTLQPDVTLTQKFNGTEVLDADLTGVDVLTYGTNSVAFT